MAVWGNQRSAVSQIHRSACLALTMLSLCFFLPLDIWFEFQQQLDYVYVTKGNDVLVFDQVNLIK